MSVRDFLEKHQKAVVTGASAVIGLAIIAVAVQVYRQMSSTAPQGYFYTVDEGKTYFADREVRIPPFEYDGKTAIRAHVGRQSDGTVKVFYVERLKPDAHAVVVKLRSNKPTTDAEMQALAQGLELKATGGDKWQTFKDSAAKATWVQSLVGSDKQPPVYLND